MPPETRTGRPSADTETTQNIAAKLTFVIDDTAEGGQESCDTTIRCDVPIKEQERRVRHRDRVLRRALRDLPLRREVEELRDAAARDRVELRRRQAELALAGWSE